jgi:hypothetical protein
VKRGGLLKNEEPEDPELKYKRKPWASLYNVIMRLRENVVSIITWLFSILITDMFLQTGYRHCLLIVKLNDFESKHDRSEQITEMYSKIVNNEGETFMNKVTGLCCIMGNYYL